MESINNQNYDVVIVGGGIVGLTLACLLGNSELTVAIIDKRYPANMLTDAIDLRVSAITPATKNILTKINSWQRIPAAKISAFRNMLVWTPEGSCLEFSGAEIGVPELGYIIENNVLQTVLYQQLLTYSNIHFIAPAELTQLNCFDNHIELKIDNHNLQASLVVGADGANSKVRQLAQLDITERDYQHTSIIATITTQQSHQETARQKFLATGPIAFLPLPDAHTCSIVWSTMPAEAEKLMQKSDEEFNKELAQVTDYHLGNILSISKRVAFPLRRRHAKNYVQKNIALIGDAAHTIHPLAGQGLNLGILDAACLAEVLLIAKQKHRAIGSYATLRSYERARKTDNLLMFSVVDGLKELFTIQSAPVKWARNLGLGMTNKFSLLKNYLIKQAIEERN